MKGFTLSVFTVAVINPKREECSEYSHGNILDGQNIGKEVGVVNEKTMQNAQSWLGGYWIMDDDPEKENLMIAKKKKKWTSNFFL